MWNQSLYRPKEFLGISSSNNHINTEEEIEEEEGEEKKQIIKEEIVENPKKEEEEEEIKKVSLLLLLKSSFNFYLFIRILYFLLGLLFLILSVLLSLNIITSPPISSTSQVELYKWLGFTSILILSFPFSRVLIYLTCFVLLKAKPKWTTIGYYYIKVTKIHLAILIMTICWLIGWYLFIIETNDDSFFYPTQFFWSLFVSSLLLYLAKLFKEISASFFERTTYWNLVSEVLKREFLIWKCSPGNPIPFSVVSSFHEFGSEATKNDPKVLRQCTKYIRKSNMMSYSNIGSIHNPIINLNQIIEISNFEDLNDLSIIIFDYIWNLLYNNHRGEEDVYLKFKILKSKRNGGSFNEQAIRTLFTGGKPRSSSSRNLLMHRPKSVFIQDKDNTNNNSSSSLKKIFKKDFENKMFLNETSINPTDVWRTIFDPNDRGYSSLKYLRNSLLRFHNERIGLGLTLNDSQAAVDRLGTVYYGVAIIGIIIAVTLLFSGTSSYNAWIAITSLFIALAVVFGNTLKNIVENIVFIFFRHPFDVGDLILIDSTYYSVKKLELLSTVLIKWNGNLLQVENTILAHTQLLNLTRSGLYWEVVECSVDIATCMNNDFMVKLREHLQKFLNSNPDSYSGKFQCIARGISRPLQVKIQAYVEFSYRPVNLTKLFNDIGNLNEAFSMGLKLLNATETGVGIGGVLANNNVDTIQTTCLLTPNIGVFGRNKVLSDVIGL